MAEKDDAIDPLSLKGWLLKVRLVESNLSMHNAMVEKKLNNSLSASYFDCIVKEKRQGSRRPFSLGDTNRRWFAIEDLK
eukprot:4797028-Ditylum_brightwellii.AAC.1